MTEPKCVCWKPTEPQRDCPVHRDETVDRSIRCGHGVRHRSYSEWLEHALVVDCSVWIMGIDQRLSLDVGRDRFPVS